MNTEYRVHALCADVYLSRLDEHFIGISDEWGLSQAAP